MSISLACQPRVIQGTEPGAEEQVILVSTNEAQEW